jgi:hypothetical protein
MIPPFAPFERPFESVEAALVTAGVVEVVEVEEVDIVEEAVELTGSGAARPVTVPASSPNFPFLRKQPCNPKVTQSSDSQSTRAGASIAASTG